MATLLKADGTTTSDVDISTLQKQQDLVGGYIEYVRVPSSPRETLIVHEEGLLEAYPVVNEEATILAQKTIVGDAVLAINDELN